MCQSLHTVAPSLNSAGKVLFFGGGRGVSMESSPHTLAPMGGKNLGHLNVKDTRSNFTPWRRVSEHQDEKQTFGGCCNLPFGELG